MAPSRRRRGPLSPNPELWAALSHGPGLRRVVEDFYARVFADERLAPFFHGMNIDWVVGKQYNFLSSIFTGERTYFGARPRNAHHWMVISNELFDYREALLEQCLRRHGLADHLIAQFRAVDEVFRKQIVKTRPRPMRVSGDDMPLFGHERFTVSVALLCDGCEQEVEVEHTAYHHIRTGKVYCEPCHADIAKSDDSWFQAHAAQ